MIDRLPVKVWGDITTASTGIVVFHGMTEHAGCYHTLGDWFAGQGGVVVAVDHVGHGQSHGGVLGDIGPAGWPGVVLRAGDILESLCTQAPTIRWFLLGHSMGSFVAQDVLLRRGAMTLRGVILSGAAYEFPVVTQFGLMVASVLGWILGDHTQGAIIDRILYGGFNRPFQPARTRFDWLSRDHAVVDAYIDDALCGFVPPIGFYKAMFRGVRDLFKATHFKQFPELPVLIMSGGNDSVTKNGKASQQLATLYRRAGHTDVTLKLFPDLRHVILNEIDDDVVYATLAEWINSR